MDCEFDPSEMVGQPIGMFHCPLCGEMVVAGSPHPDYSIGLSEAEEEELWMVGLERAGSPLLLED